MTTTPGYPLVVEGRLDPGLGRWLWLLKWLLAIPHYLVLAVLWIVFVVLSLVALVAIVFTGRYPRGIFDFNVGVLRWSWRVAFYSYGALGTDRYPPFTLADVPGYPATLHVEYPGQLSRGLVLVKWWLLAIPHYLVVGLFVGGGGAYVWEAQHSSWGAGGDLIGLLVLIAAVALLFTGRYPGGIFDLVLGLDRWVLRVVAYAALMTDVYPPFRLDLGSTESVVPLPAAETGPAEPHPHGTAGRVVETVAGALLVLVSLAVLAAGGVGLWADRTQRDADGYLMTHSEQLSTSRYALSSQGLDIAVEGPHWLWKSSVLGTIRIRGAASGGRPLFIGVGRVADVNGYLAGVAHSEVTDVSAHPFSVAYRDRAGGAPPAPPTDRTFWAASVSGAGVQTLSWHVETGHWSIVVMNADGSRPVSADLAIGARLSYLLWLAVGLLAGGAIALLGGSALVYLGLARRE